MLADTKNKNQLLFMKKTNIIISAFVLLVVTVGLALWITADSGSSVTYDFSKEVEVSYGEQIHSPKHKYVLDGVEYSLQSKNDREIILLGSTDTKGIVCSFKGGQVVFEDVLVTEQHLIKSSGGEGDLLKRVLLVIILKKNNPQDGKANLLVQVRDIGWEVDTQELATATSEY
jgi:hypothetical protein